MTSDGALILVVDDDDDLREAQVETLALAGYAPTGVSSADEALARLEAASPHVVLSDIRMPGLDGLEFHKRLAAIDPELPFILMTGHGDIDMAVAALHCGVFDFLPKPFGADRLLPVIQRAARQRRLVLENRRLTQLVENAEAEEARSGLIGQAPAIVRLRETIAQVARAGVDVLIQGESGVGKEIVARGLHRSSARRARPFVVVNCAALPEDVLDAELFGRSPTSGYGRRIGGRVREADGGTLLLEEVEALSPALQIKLLKLMETGQISGEDDQAFSLRFLTTTRIDLDAAAARGAFRSDLYYRLSVVTLTLPSLRDRREDIPLLFRHLVSQAAARQKKTPPPIDDAIDAHLMMRDWPGNVRELAQAAERFVIGLDRNGGATGVADGSLSERVEAFEARVLDEALKAAKGDVRAVMARLDLPRKTFYAKVKRHGIVLDDYRRGD